MSDLSRWLGRWTDGAPAALRTRLMDVLARQPDRAPPPERLARAAGEALEASIAAAGRTGALDLLVADALVTLALLYEAHVRPADLAALARTIRLRPLP